MSWLGCSWCWWAVSCCCLFDCFGLFVGFVVSILCIYVLVISCGIYVFDIAFLTSVLRCNLLFKFSLSLGVSSGSRVML